MIQNLSLEPAFWISSKGLELFSFFSFSFFSSLFNSFSWGLLILALSITKFRKWLLWIQIPDFAALVGLLVGSGIFVLLIFKGALHLQQLYPISNIRHCISLQKKILSSENSKRKIPAGLFICSCQVPSLMV